MCPSMLSYSRTASTKPLPGLHLTPPTFGVYMIGLVVEHLALTGGVAAAERQAKERAASLYDLIDESRVRWPTREGPAQRPRRSRP